MKKTIILLASFIISVAASAEIGDAFKGILPVTDKKMTRNIGGKWRLKVTEGIGDTKTVPAEDATWGTIDVPGCWDTNGFCEARYSFPDSLTGYYRTTFEVPEEWKGMLVAVQFDGVLRGYDLWLNDRYVGSWEQGYTSCVFDLTPFLNKKGKQQLAMRVYSRFKGFEFDCFDDWAPMGIIRDVTLFAVPKTHLSDLTVTTKTNGEVTVKTEIANADKHTKVEYEIYDATGKVVSTGGKIENVQLWTAETPYLYTLKLWLKRKDTVLQTFEQKIGIRETSIENGKVLKLNGRAIKLRGVTCHATDPQTGKVISDELTLKDMKMMKEAGINYIRTSHYPRERRFYELCDSLGFYVVNEVPFGSRGEKHLKKPDYLDILKTRAAATIARDKNHPSVLIWSLGNENPLPESCVEVGRFAKQCDSTRPICYPQKGSYFRRFKFKNFPEVADIYAPHYPTTSQLKDFYTKADRVTIFTEYCHTLGISFEDHDRQWEIIEKTPALAGGSVWEWCDQGMPFTLKKDRENIIDGRMYGYEERVFTSPRSGFQMSGNLGTDGIVYADRTPLPNYYELQHNYSQACVTDTLFDGVLHIRNRYDFIDLKDNVSFAWSLTSGRDTVANGCFSPACAPHSTTAYKLDLPVTSPDKRALLHITVTDRANRTLLRQTVKVHDGKHNAIASQGNADALIQQGPLVRVGRKPTMAENIKVNNERIERYLQPIDNPYVKATVTTDGANVSYCLTPDTAKHFLSELGVAYLLDASLDRVQWTGYGPFASYPGRQRANRLGYWALHKDDIYFEGNRMGVETVWVSDAKGNGLVFDCKGGNVNFEQTDRGLVITVNAAVSGEGPKFGKTSFGVWSDKTGTHNGSFAIYRTDGSNVPDSFVHPSEVAAPFRPFLTQYDTYLMRLQDITPETGK